jgi:hypothetical protein
MPVSGGSKFMSYEAKLLSERELSVSIEAKRPHAQKRKACQVETVIAEGNLGACAGKACDRDAGPSLLILR